MARLPAGLGDLSNCLCGELRSCSRNQGVRCRGAKLENLGVDRRIGGFVRNRRQLTAFAVAKRIFCAEYEVLAKVVVLIEHSDLRVSLLREPLKREASRWQATRSCDSLRRGEG